MTTQTVEIRILGKTTRVSCPAGQEQALIEAAQDFNRRLQELSQRTKVSNTEQLLTITALNLSHELMAERLRQDEDQSRMLQMEQRIMLLQRSIEQALIKHNVTTEAESTA